MEECFFAWNSTLGDYQIVHVGEGESIACRECDILEREIENILKESANA